MTKKAVKRINESICWDCKNGYATKCAWISKCEKVWTKAKKEIRTGGKKDYKMTIYIVRECEYYAPEARKGALG